MAFRDQALDALKTYGGRMTAQRWALIDLLDASDSQIDAESLYELAHQQDASISLATVYRTLNTLADAGVIQRRYLSPDHDRQYFERMPDESTYFLTCRECRRTISFQTDLIQRLKIELASAYGWHALNICVCSDGICPECSAKQQEKDQHDS